MALGATCVQRLDGSRDSAIHTKYRISLRSSSMREPRYPLPRVVLTYKEYNATPQTRTVSGVPGHADSLKFLGAFCAGVRLYGLEGNTNVHRPATPGDGTPQAKEVWGSRAPRPRVCFTSSRVVLLCRVSTMILPQVHLRKPCYDFSFL